ncbi:UDP-N-acetylglucosamine 2-epimerase [Chlamydiota bacterium]
MKKVCIVVASRANYGRIKALMRSIQDDPELELQLIVGASALLYRFGKVIDVIINDGFTPTATIYMVLEGENLVTMAKSTGLAIQELATVFENLRPDIVLTVADRYETMATAIASSYMNIPLVHIQGGELSGSIDESVRHAITKLAHGHMVTTERSRDFVIRLGEDPSKVFLTGCPSIDVIANIDLSLGETFEKYGGVGDPTDPTKPYLVVLQHSVTTEFGKGFEQINQTLQAVASLSVQTIWLWPNVDAGSDDISKGLRMFREKNPQNNVHFYRNFSVEDYARIINNCVCLIGNSSSAIREGAFLGVPAVNIGSRQDRRERGKNVLDVGYNSQEITQAIAKQIAHGKYPRETLYGDGCASKKIVEILKNTPFSIQKKLWYL